MLNTLARPALQRIPASPLLRGSLEAQPNRAKAARRFSPAAATDSNLLHSQLNLALKPSLAVEPINVANLRVNQRSHINEDTVEPLLTARILIL